MLDLRGVNWDGRVCGSVTAIVAAVSPKNLYGICEPFGLSIACSWDPSNFSYTILMISYCVLLHIRMPEGHCLLRIAMGNLTDLNVMISLSKMEGPSTKVTFLGILINTIQFEL